MRWFYFIVFLAAFSANAQQTGQNASLDSDGTPTISLTTQLVVETVTPRDKKGNFVPGLTTKNFSVTEEAPAVTAQTSVTTPQAEGEIKVYRKLVQTRIADEAPGHLSYRDRRLLVLYFDMTAMGPTEQRRALESAQKFIQTEMTPSDLISIVRYGGAAVEVLQDFTDDRQRLLRILETLKVGEGQDYAEGSDSAGAGDSGAAFGQDDGEFNVFNTNRQLAALQNAVEMLAHLSEKKSFIYFAGGIRMSGTANLSQLRATIDSAIRAGVSFWPVDARGLVAAPPMGDAAQASPGGIEMYTGAAIMAQTATFQQSQDTLYALASDTGGKAMLDSNDLTKGIVQAQRAISDYYIVGYYTTNTAQDGKFRHIRIACTNCSEATLDYRQGYYAGKQFDKFTTADKEQQLEEALMLEDPVTELTIALEINYFEMNRAEYFVPIMVKIPGRELALAKHGGAEHTMIDFIGEIKDSFGATVTNLRDTMNIRLTEDTAVELAKRPIEYAAGFTLYPGKYTIKILARDNETGRIGTFQANFVIPNLVKEEKSIPVSSVVLSSQSVAPNEALYNAMRPKDRDKQLAVNPLVQNDQMMIPSVTRVFSKSRKLDVFLQAYRQAAGVTQPLIAYVSLQDEQKKIFASQPVELLPEAGSRLGTTPIRFSIPLAALPAGKFDCQVTILDPTTQKGTFWQAPVMIVP
jgi:VWFA-related protein